MTNPSVKEPRSWGRREITSTRNCSTVAAAVVDDDVVCVVATDGVVARAAESFAESLHAQVDAAMSNAASPRRIDLFTLRAMVIG